MTRVPSVALVGNPNVGKSTLFNQVTGRGVVTAHYAGKTLDVNIAETAVDGTRLRLIDLPGTYGISGAGEEQQVNRRALLEEAPSAVLVVLDAANLTRNLLLALQVLDLGLPTVLVVNLVDEARRLGLRVDAAALAEELGVPVFETVALEGVGVAELMDYVALVATGAAPLAPPTIDYGEAVEGVIRALADSVRTTRSADPAVRLAPRAVALQFLEGHPDFDRSYENRGLVGLMRVVREARGSLRARTGEPAAAALARARHGVAGLIAERVLVHAKGPPPLRARITTWATRPVVGVLMLATALLAIFGLLFFVGDILARGVSGVWAAVFSPAVQTAVGAVAGDGPVGRALLWGLDAGIEALLAIGLPYILTFYMLLSLLEDTGYLNAVAFLSDRIMHRVGLHGRATIPLVAGLGCSVPAVLSVRLLSTERERFIGATLVSMVPCSARTAVIMGAVGVYVGFWPAFSVYGITALVAAAVGVTMDRMLPGETTGMVMEMFPFRRPSLRVVGRKAWAQFREFVFVATPIVVVGSIILGGLYESDLIWRLTAPMDPVIVGWLGLPSVAGLTLLFGLLRKEFALQLLVTLAIATVGLGARELSSFMSQTDIFVYALVNTLALPCISTLAVLAKLLDVKRAVLVAAITVGVALLVGGAFAKGLPLVLGA